MSRKAMYPPPPGSVSVPEGLEVEFQRKISTRKDRAKHGPKTAGNALCHETVWTVTKMAGVESCLCCGECETDALVRKYQYLNDRLLGEPETIEPYVDPSRDGQKRFRVWIDGTGRYLHAILAFAFHRDWACPHICDYPKFRANGFQGDHLAWVRSGQFFTQPEMCLCGWIEAVGKSQHDQRTSKLKRGRAVVDRVVQVEKQEAEATAEIAMTEANFESLRRKDGGRGRKLQKRIRSLKAVQQSIEKKRSAGMALLKKEWPDPEALRAQIAKSKGAGSFVTFDGVVSGDGEFQAFDGNELLGELFVDAETDGRRALILYANRLLNSRAKVR